MNPYTESTIVVAIQNILEEQPNTAVKMDDLLDSLKSAGVTSRLKDVQLILQSHTRLFLWIENTIQLTADVIAIHGGEDRARQSTIEYLTKLLYHLNAFQDTPVTIKSLNHYLNIAPKWVHAYLNWLQCDIEQFFQRHSAIFGMSITGDIFLLANERTAETAFEISQLSNIQKEVIAFFRDQIAHGVHDLHTLFKNICFAPYHISAFVYEHYNEQNFHEFFLTHREFFCIDACANVTLSQADITTGPLTTFKAHGVSSKGAILDDVVKSRMEQQVIRLVVDVLTFVADYGVTVLTVKCVHCLAACLSNDHYTHLTEVYGFTNIKEFIINKAGGTCKVTKRGNIQLTQALTANSVKRAAVQSSATLDFYRRFFEVLRLHSVNEVFITLVWDLSCICPPRIASFIATQYDVTKFHKFFLDHPSVFMVDRKRRVVALSSKLPIDTETQQHASFVEAAHKKDLVRLVRHQLTRSSPVVLSALFDSVKVFRPQSFKPNSCQELLSFMERYPETFIVSTSVGVIWMNEKNSFSDTWPLSLSLKERELCGLIIAYMISLKTSASASSIFKFICGIFIDAVAYVESMLKEFDCQTTRERFASFLQSHQQVFRISDECLVTLSWPVERSTEFFGCLSDAFVAILKAIIGSSIADTSEVCMKLRCKLNTVFAWHFSGEHCLRRFLLTQQKRFCLLSKTAFVALDYTPHCQTSQLIDRLFQERLPLPLLSVVQNLQLEFMMMSPGAICAVILSRADLFSVGPGRMLHAKFAGRSIPSLLTDLSFGCNYRDVEKRVWSYLETIEPLEDSSTESSDCKTDVVIQTDADTLGTIWD